MNEKYAKDRQTERMAEKKYFTVVYHVDLYNKQCDN